METDWEKVTRGLKATINDGRVSTVYCTEHRKWDVKTVFRFICCKEELCAPCGVHCRTRNGGFHFKVWKSSEEALMQGSWGTGIDCWARSWRLWDWSSFKTSSKDSGVRTGPCGLYSPLQKGDIFYKCALKVCSVIKTNMVSMYLKHCPTSAEIIFMQNSQSLMSKWTWNQGKNTLKSPPH